MLLACLLMLIFYLMGACLLVCLTTSNPMLLVFWLIFSALTGSIYMGLTLSSWLMYAFILLYVGGMMVLFCYMISLIFFSKVVLGSVSPAATLLFSLAALTLFRLAAPGNSSVLSGAYGAGSGPVLLYISVYLLGVLVAVVKMVTGWEGSMKTIIKNDSSH